MADGGIVHEEKVEELTTKARRHQEECDERMGWIPSILSPHVCFACGEERN
jgi:hypothetical protein